MSETIDFKFNKPETLTTLAYADGRNVPSRYPGSIRIMRSTTDQKLFFCDPQLESKIKALVPVQGMQLQITKLEREAARKGFDWKVERIGEQQDARAIALTVYIQAGRSGKLRWNPRRGERRAG